MIATAEWRQRLVEFVAERPDALDLLDTRQRNIVQRTLPAPGHTRETLQIIGKSLGISREYVRQIEREALVRLHQFRREDRRKCSHCDGRGWLAEVPS